MPGEALAKFRGPSLVIGAEDDVFFPGRAVIARAKEILEDPETILMKDRHMGAGVGEETRAQLLRFLAETDQDQGPG